MFAKIVDLTNSIISSENNLPLQAGDKGIFYIFVLP
jgi:hypothetical protein